MSKNPFLNFQQFVSKPPRNSVDLSHRYNGTFGFGTLYPVLCCEVDPGDTFSIESAFGLKFFPMPFPVQTPMRATMHFYYVRNRTIWKDFPDFIYNNKSANLIPHPFITRPASDTEFWKTGGICDYLDVPTTIIVGDGLSLAYCPGFGLLYSTSPVGSLSPISNLYTSFSVVNISSTYAANVPVNYLSDPRCFIMSFPDGNIDSETGLIHPFIHFDHNQVPAVPDRFEEGTYLGLLYGGFDSFYIDPETNSFQITLHGMQLGVTIPSGVIGSDFSCFLGFNERPFVRDNESKASNPKETVFFAKLTVSSVTGISAGSYSVTFTLSVSDSVKAMVDEFSTRGGSFWFFLCQNPVQQEKIVFFPKPWVRPNLQMFYPGYCASLTVVADSSSDLSSGNFGNPFSGSDPVLPLSALPFRCYEAIYNAYYRNERLEPLIIDGQPEYNKYCPNMESGADNFPYRLYKRNWEADFLTSSLPTPQQGIAPVVGVAGLSDIQIQDPDSNEIFNFTAKVDNDGETIVGGSFHDPGATAGVRRTAQEIVTAGFTINDFRNVNALQRWLENNFRRGLKYRDQILANTGVKVKYDELDMPEFIGGFSRPVQVSSITQTAPGGDLGLGDYGGQANCFGQSKHRISHYCDEAGFIMGILCVTPQPVYSQLLPKHFLKRTALDYHHPVMNHIGMQPITYDQVCPLQVFASNPSQSQHGVRFNDVFGYQRPYYDLLAKTDSVHGQMRTTLRDYVMNRTFSDVPELGAEFIHVDPKQLNQVFNMTSGDEDVIMGEILFRIFAKRTVSLFGQPKIV